MTDVTSNSVGLSWMVPEGRFDSFMVQYEDRDGQPHVVPVAADQLKVTVPNLEPATTYKMDVYGVHGGQHVGPLSVVVMTGEQRAQDEAQPWLLRTPAPETLPSPALVPTLPH